MTIKISHLNKKIGKQQILKDINLNIQDGEIVALLGPNGAGKSSLMKCLTGLWSFDSGELEVCGVNMKKDPHAVASLVGYLPELNPLYEDMYVTEYLMFMAEMGRVKNIKQRVQEVIERVGLLPEVHKKIGQLSKGYKQRVGLAQAILGEPQLLILDEPTTGLDPEQLIDIRQLIIDLSKTCTILLSTHILQEVEAVCSRALIIAHGELKADITDLRGVDLNAAFRKACGRE